MAATGTVHGLTDRHVDALGWVGFYALVGLLWWLGHRSGLARPARVVTVHRPAE